jgi:hypothetical protein
MAELPPCNPSSPLTNEKVKREKDKRKERKKVRSNPDTGPAAPEPCARSLPLLHFGRELPNFSGRQEVHHRLVALFYGKQLRDLHVSGSSRFPARRLPHRLPQFFLMIFPPASVAEEVLPRLGHCPSTPPALVVISVAEPFQLNSSGRVT